MKWDDSIACAETTNGTKWKIRYRVPLGPDTRATKQVVETLVGCKNKKQARQVLAKRMAAVFDGTYRERTIAAPVTLNDFAETFFAAKSELRTLKEYKRVVNNHLLRLLGRKQMRSMTVVDCDDYRRKRLAEDGAPKTVRNELAILQSMFAEARRRKLVDNDPVADVPFGKIDNARRRLLGAEERDRLLAVVAARRDWLRPLFVVLYYTGLRLGDVLSLTWDRVDFERGILLVKTRKTGVWVYPPLHPTLHAELERWRDDWAGTTKWVFPSSSDQSRHIGVHSVAKPWNDMIKKAGIDKLWRHDLRRHFVTMLRAAGVGDGVIRQYTGHTTLAMIERYDSPDQALARSALDKLPDLTPISDSMAIGSDIAEMGQKSSNNSKITSRRE